MENQEFIIEEGALMAYTGAGGAVVIPDGVVEIGGFVFEARADVTAVTIPASISYIGEWAMANCPALTDVWYAGTQREWETIVKEDNWDSGTTGYALHCREEGAYRVVYVDVDPSADFGDDNVIVPQMLDKSFDTAEQARTYLTGNHILRLRRDLAEEIGYDAAETAEIFDAVNGDRVTIFVMQDDVMIARHEYTIVKVK